MKTWENATWRQRTAVMLTSRGKIEDGQQSSEDGAGASGAESLPRESPTGKWECIGMCQGSSLSSCVGHHPRHILFLTLPRTRRWRAWLEWVGAGGSWGNSNWHFKLIKEMPLTTWGPSSSSFMDFSRKATMSFREPPPLPTPQLVPGQW